MLLTLQGSCFEKNLHRSQPQIKVCNFVSLTFETVEKLNLLAFVRKYFGDHCILGDLSAPLPTPPCIRHGICATLLSKTIIVCFGILKCQETPPEPNFLVPTLPGSLSLAVVFSGFVLGQSRWRPLAGQIVSNDQLIFHRQVNL